MKNEIYLDKKATEIVRKVVGGGGTIKVDELPEIGKEHTIYELSETVEGNYRWVLSPIIQKKLGDALPVNYGSNGDAPVIVVVENEEDKLNVSGEYNIYVRSTDKLYYLGEQDWEEAPHLTKRGQFGDDEFKIIVCSDYTSNVEFNGQYIGTITYTCLDGSVETYTLEIEEDPHYPYIVQLHQVENLTVMNIGIEALKFDTLPTREYLLENELVSDSYFATIKPFEVNGKVFDLLLSTDNYFWNQENYNFYANGMLEQIYTGDIEYEEVPLEVTENLNYKPKSPYIYKPIKEGEVTSYWVYNNNSWEKLDSGTSTCSIFVEVTYSTITPSKMWSAPKLSEIITECNYTITDLENYDWVNSGGETDVYGTKSTGIISGLPITSMEDRDFTEIVVKIPNIDVFAGEIYVSSCYFNNIGLNSDGNHQYSLENYVGGYLLIDAAYRALS